MSDALIGKHLCQRRRERLRDERRLLGRDDKRRREKNVIPARTVNTTLRRISQNARLHRSRPNFFGNGLRWIECRPCGLVSNKFDTKKESEPADLADMTMGFQRTESGEQRLSCGSDARKQIVRFDVIKNGVAGSCRNGMSLVSESMLEGSGAILKSFDNIRRDENSSERCIAAGDSLPRQNNVRFHAPVLHREWFSRAADASHHFIGDK